MVRLAREWKLVGPQLTFQTDARIENISLYVQLFSLFHFKFNLI